MKWSQYWFTVQDKVFNNFWSYCTVNTSHIWFKKISLLLIISKGQGRPSFACWNSNPFQHLHEAVLGSWDAWTLPNLVLLANPGQQLSDWTENEAKRKKKNILQKGTFKLLLQTKHANFPSLWKKMPHESFVNQSAAKFLRECMYYNARVTE